MSYPAQFNLNALPTPVHSQVRPTRKFVTNTVYPSGHGPSYRVDGVVHAPPAGGYAQARGSVLRFRHSNRSLETTHQTNDLRQGEMLNDAPILPYGSAQAQLDKM